MSWPPRSTTRRSKHSCRPARTLLTISVSAAEAAFGSEPQVIPQYGAACAGVVRTTAPSAAATVRTRSRMGVDFMASLLTRALVCAAVRIRRHDRQYHRQPVTVNDESRRVGCYLLPALGAP